MSDRFGLKVKENAGKTKYSSLNLNQTYKGTKVETKTSSGTARHGLQSLGKVGASRRIPPPANLPSLKSENSGNDPTVSLVPSGGGGWGSAKEKPSETTPAAASQAAPPSSTPSQTNAPSSQQPLLQPQRPIPPPSHPQPVQPQSQSSGQTQNQPAKQQESQVKTWGTVSSNEAGGQGRSYSHQEMPYFNREFPVLGGGNSGERPPLPSEIKEQPPTQYGQKQIMRNTHEPPWMERSGPGPPPSDYGTARERTDAFNGGPGHGGGHQYRRPPDYPHGSHGRNVPQGHLHHHGNGPQSHGPGRHPHGYPPDHFSRGPGQRPSAPSGPNSAGKLGDKTRGEGYGRPSILKPEDIQAMTDNDEEEEGGWAGAQDEVDYAAKLDFEDFEDDDKPSLEQPVKPEIETPSGEPETRWQGNESRPAKGMGPPPTRPAWTESSGPVYSENRQMPPSPGMRPFDSRGSPPNPGWPMPYPQHLAGQPRGGHPPGHPPPSLVSSDQVKPASKSEEPVTNDWQKRRVKQQEEMRAAVERARKRREEEEMRRQAEQKAGATAKLKELELKRVRRESAKEGDDAWAEELDSIEKDSYGKGPYPEQRMPETPEREVEPQNLALNQQDDLHGRNDFPEHVSHRQRNDSESSDASRSSARGASRPHHHPPRDIPPRFQQQQLRQQHFQQQQHYQQQQPYPPQHPYHQQQMARSPQLRDFPEGSLSVANHPIVDSGPVSPSQPTKPDVSVKRIMKRSDSSSTAGDDIASVKSLESASGEPSREVEKKPHAAPSDKAIKTDAREEKTKEGSSEATRKESNRTDRKPDDQDLPVFDDSGSGGSGDTSQKRTPDSVLPQGSGKQDLTNKENDVSKERVHDKRERKDDESTSKAVSEKGSRFRDRRDERRSSSKRDSRTQDNRRSDDSKDSGKRKREDSEDAERFTERRGRFAGRGGDPKRERFSESHSRGRVSFPVRGRGMAGTATSYRGRGRGDRGNRDNRDYKEHKPTRSREPRPSSAWKTTKDEQKRNEEDKENVVAKENANAIASESDKKVTRDSTEVKQDKRIESVPSTDEKEANKQEKRNEETVTEVKKNKEDDSVTRESKFEEEVRLPNKDLEKVKESDDVSKKPESPKDVNNLKPKARGGFGRPPQSSQDLRNVNNQDRREGGKKFNDRRRPIQEAGRDRKTDSDDKRTGRNYSRDNTNQRQTGRDNRYRERGQERDQKFQYQRDERDTGNKRYSQDDRKKRFDDKDDDQQNSRRKGDERNQRGGTRSYSSRGRVSTTPVRTNIRGGRSSQPVGSGRFGNNYRRVKSSEEELSDDDYESDSSSYTTATSASEERRDEKPSNADNENDVKREKESSSTFDKSRASSRSARSPIRGKMSSRAGRRGTGGGFGRTRREVERPPRFQKQQEKERASMGRGAPQGVRTNESRESGPGRGRGRGRGKREQPQRDEGPGIPVTEDWDEELNEAQKGTESSKSDKSGGRRESTPRRGFSGPRSSSERGRKDKSRDAGGTRGNSSRREPFLAERQQAKVDGSKLVGGEPRGPLPAARNGFSKDGNRRSDMHSTGLDSINTGVTDTKTPKKQETPVRKTDIQQFDLHNIAGVICIDDMTDDESDKSSTHSGFVEVTSRRTQKENKDRQREEEERRKKVDEQNRQRGSQMGNKKNQSSKPPRFSKQHTSQVNTQSKSPGVIGKATSTAVSETAIGTAITGSNSNPSSANSTKRNSPVNVERPVSPPPPPPVFNAWDKPLLLTPAKPPSASPPVTSSIPDPLAVGSGKPSSTRVVQPQGTVISSAASLIEDISVDDDYLAMTKEIALLAPPEEPEESEEPAHITQNTKLEKRDQTMEKGAKVAGPSEKRSQAKPQRDKPPRFDRSSKRKAASGAEDAKKEWSSNTKGRKSSRDDTVPQKLTKGSADNTAKGKTGTLSSKKQQSASTGDEVANDRDTSKGEQESAEYISAGRNVGTTVSDEGSDGKDDIKEEEAKNDSGSESSRKDSELDLNVDSGDRNDDNEHLFGTETLSVDIHERPTAERPDREPSPVSPAIFEMSKKMEASRKLWDSGIAIGRSSNHGGAWEETLRTPASVGSSIVGMSVVESAESRLSDDQVAVKKPQVELEANTSKNDSKSPDGLNFAKKSGSGEQQNVCKVKPQQQQQQPVKTQQSSSIVSQPAEENHQTELNTVSLVPPLLSQELLTQQAMQHRYAIPLVGAFVDAPQRQPFLQQQQLQQLQQTNQQVTPTFSLTHVQQVNQARSSSSPLSQATQDMYQSPFLPGGVYSGNFQGSQPYVSIGLLPSTATQSFVTSSPRTQTTSLIGIQAQQPKPGTGSVFAQNVTQQGTQTMFMQYDPKTLRGGTPLFNIAQHPQSAQRQLLGTQPGVVGENLSRQSGFPAGQPTPQPFQGTYPFQQKQGTYDVSQDMQMKKTAEQSTDFTRQSELVKHVNAKPFEPPKRSTPGSVPPSSASIGPLMSSTFARNPNLMTITPSPTDIGGSSQSPPVSTTLLSGRQVSMSPVEPGIPFHGAVGTFPKHTINQFQLQQQPQGVQPQQFTPFQQQPVSLQQTIQVRAQGQQQQQGGNPLQGAGTAILPNPAVIAAAMPRQLIRAPSLGPIGIGGAQPSATNTQRFPAPIQRPVTASLMHGVPHIQAPRGPRAQTAPPPPPQMMSAKQQIVTNRPHLPPQSLPHPPPQSLPHPEAVAAAFKIEQHHKMLEQTKMFFAQQQGPQQRVPLLSNQVDPQVKPIGSFQGDKPIVKGQVPRENLKFQEKKEEAKSHISETNQRNRKPNLEQPSKTSKTTKVDSKPEESSKDKTNTSKQDGKGPGNKSSSLVRIPPLPMAPRNVPKRARAPPRMPGSQPVSKPRISGRSEKEIKDTVQDQPSETPSRKSSDQAKPSEAQPVDPLSVNK